LGWLAAIDLIGNDGALTNFRQGIDHLYMLLSYRLELPVGEEISVTICLARGLSEAAAVEAWQGAVTGAQSTLEQKITVDDAFYSSMPLLQGDWPETWKHGWIYDFETLRMNVRSPLGIYHYHWDGMQVHVPRLVLAETALICSA
jgi:hypothetical protein